MVLREARHNMYNVSVGTVTLYIYDCEHVKFGGWGPESPIGRKGLS